jgi:DNA-binding transcriptional LysR family regulator
VRSTRRVELTEAGRAPLPAAQRGVAAAEDGLDAVAGVRGLVRGQLAIGIIQTQTVGALNDPALCRGSSAGPRNQARPGSSGPENLAPMSQVF